MADIRVNVGITVDQAGLRNVQQELTRAVRDISPQLNVAVDQQRLQRLIQRPAENINVQIQNIGLTGAARSSFRRAVQQSAENILIRQVGFDRRALTRLRDQLRQQISQLPALSATAQAATAQQQQAATIQGPGGQGAREAAAKLAEQATKAVADAENAIARTLTQIDAANRRRAQGVERIARSAEQERAEQDRRAALIAQLPSLTRQQIQANQSRTRTDQTLNTLLEQQLSAQSRSAATTREIRAAQEQRLRSEQLLSAQVAQTLSQSDLPAAGEVQQIIPAGQAEAFSRALAEGAKLEREAREIRENARRAAETLRELSEAERRALAEFNRSVTAAGRLAIEQERVVQPSFAPRLALSYKKKLMQLSLVQMRL
jgi:hypothetical protein